MFKNVLVGVDGRPNGRDAIALASRLADPDRKLTLAHVHSGETADERRDSHKLLEQERSASGVAAELISLVSASPGRGLHEQAERLGADLLVVGSCHRGVFGRATLGDETRAALNGAPCAVAVASLGYAEHSEPIAKIGIGYDESEESKVAFAAARELATATGASAHALEVVAIPTYAFTGFSAPVSGNGLDEMLKDRTDRLEGLADVDARAVYGLAGEELAAFGDGLDILVIGSRGYGPMRRFVVGSTSDYLERHARCSLLVPRRAASAATSTP